MAKIYDVVIVGAGPGGAAAAKRSAEKGLATLLIEKQQLPRSKVCGGMIMGPYTRTLIRSEFGEIPTSVLSQPSILVGYEIHVPKIGSQKLDNFTPLCWRKDFDYWLVQQAEAKGARVMTGCRFTGIEKTVSGLSLLVESNRNQLRIDTRCVVAADGSSSSVREAVFPEIHMPYMQGYQEGFRAEVALAKDRYHWFFAVDKKPPFFSVHQKDGSDRICHI